MLESFTIPMSDFKVARIALHIAPNDRYAPYFREAIGHAGILHEEVGSNLEHLLDGYDCLLLCGHGVLSLEQVEAISNWVDEGHSVVCCGDAWGLENILGLEPTIEGIGPSNDTMVPGPSPTGIWPDGVSMARFMGGVYAKARDTEEFAVTPNGYVAAGRTNSAYFVAPHVGQTMALMQMGRSVESDGIGPNDGTAKLDDGVLRSEDGAVLSFEVDRSATCEESGPFFESPHADVVKELWIRTILLACLQVGAAPVVFWHWPDNAPGAAAISIDCEEFDPNHVTALSRQMSMFGAKAAWFVGLPGYPLDIYRNLIKNEHEIGLLFLVEESQGWTEERIRIQQLALMRSTSLGGIVSARPVEGRWKSLTSFYDLAEGSGIKLSASKGGRQPGTSGFLFGTCHAFHPYRRDGHTYRILELPYCVFCPGMVTSLDCADRAILRAAMRWGCIHVALRSEVGGSMEGLNGIRQFLAGAKQAQLAFLTPEQIHDFERGRRSMKAKLNRNGGDWTLELESPTDLQGISVLIASKGVEFRSNSRVKTTTIKRYGIDFSSATLELDAKCPAALFLHVGESSSQAA